MILDYSYFGVNDDTLQLDPLDAMKFGRTLNQLLTRIHRANDRFGPVHLLKIDLADGFYRLWLRPEDTFWLMVLIPSRPCEPLLVSISLTNPIGWHSSLSNFYACTETMVDLANAALQDPAKKQRACVIGHHFDTLLETKPADASAAPAPDPRNPL